MPEINIFISDFMYFIFLLGRGVYKTSKTSFLFSLKNKHNLPPFKANIKTPEKATIANNVFGPLFGDDGRDLYIPSISKNTINNPHSEYGNSYELPNGGKYFPAGSFNFVSSEIEVFFWTMELEEVKINNLNMF